MLYLDGYIIKMWLNELINLKTNTENFYTEKNDVEIIFTQKLPLNFTNNYKELAHHTIKCEMLK